MILGRRHWLQRRAVVDWLLGQAWTSVAEPLCAIRLRVQLFKAASRDRGAHQGSDQKIPPWQPEERDRRREAEWHPEIRKSKLPVIITAVWSHQMGIKSS